ncbi:hypothetical protein N4T77_00195 [Clostridium sp. CX1]|uniref:hypothetical protein n=1 Tax=Clostridium sp. CX1 TaxID=2978346 RepID=UPI0021BEFE67|nr:hypothetical protein [Clostridium sp. CX1]MCT8975008.1 hypothetical protein [Clostridium sp. CX1]
MSYYKYQNVRDMQWYEEEYEKRRSEELENQQKGMFLDIPIFRNCTFDLERLQKEIDSFEEYLFVKEDHQTSLKSNLHGYISYSKATYLAPAYNYNKYIEHLIEYNINIMNKKYSKNLECYEQLFTIEIQNIFISIKCLLDRLVTILSFYYKGISITSTFGRISENNKANGLMSEVLKRKENDELMGFIYSEYNSWIKEIVEPRDIIMHYNDMYCNVHYTADGREFFMHSNIRIFDENRNDSWDLPSPDEGHYYKSLMKSVQNVYEFFDTTFEVLKKKNIIYQRYHFKEKIDFDEYKKNDYKFTQK